MNETDLRRWSGRTLTWEQLERTWDEVAKVVEVEVPSTQPGVETNGTSPPPVPPDGGTIAWIQVLSGWCLFFNSYGLLNSFGAFQKYYQSHLLEGSSASNISWIGTLQSCFILYGTIYSGPLYDWGFFRRLVATGCVLSVCGMFLTSFCHEYYQIILMQGLLTGVGLGCLLAPMVGTVAAHFEKRRGLAMGISSTGSIFGGVLYPIIFDHLVNEIGFGWAVRVITLIMAVLFIIPLLGMRMLTKPPEKRRLWIGEAWREPQFALFAVALLVAYAGMYIPFFYIQLFCTEKGFATGHLDQYLLPIINAAGLPGRLLFGYLADRIGPLNSFALASGGSTILLFVWMAVDSLPSTIAFCVLYGFCQSGITTLAWTVIATNLCPDLRQYGVRILMQSIFGATGLLIGNPIAGAILPTGWISLQGSPKKSAAM
ncbi:MFS general substrate transporter [Rhizodiscina lignyota]|uniref:MFS general substrate transporter n=1 Tax=Rhizodiscina lignyota TaxID=1504668 RepID=A0A9P4I3E5_9PEZI|nr:MFS general substrate transporter [Rhizodiscina lignyota]